TLTSRRSHPGRGAALRREAADRPARRVSRRALGRRAALRLEARAPRQGPDRNRDRPSRAFPRRRALHAALARAVREARARRTGAHRVRLVGWRRRRPRLLRCPHAERIARLDLSRATRRRRMVSARRFRLKPCILPSPPTPSCTAFPTSLSFAALRIRKSW